MKATIGFSIKSTGQLSPFLNIGDIISIKAQVLMQVTGFQVPRKVQVLVMTIKYKCFLTPPIRVVLAQEPYRTLQH